MEFEETQNRHSFILPFYWSLAWTCRDELAPDPIALLLQ
jgi:hypothetical protein